MHDLAGKTGFVTGAASGIGATEGADFQKIAEQAIAHGIDPLYVGELVREGIEGDWPYIFTDAQFEAGVVARFAAIKAGFDLIRDRKVQY
jgi:hypothetical protein